MRAVTPAVHPALQPDEQLMTAGREQLFVVKLISADADIAAITLDSSHGADIYNTLLKLICNYLFSLVWLARRRKVTFKRSRDKHTVSFCSGAKR